MDVTGASAGAGWHPMWYAVGTILAIMIGTALGASFVKERGRRVLPVVIGSTIVGAIVIGWSLDFVMYAFYAPAFH